MAPQAKDNKNIRSGGKLNGTDLIHADGGLHGLEVAPSVSVSTSESPKAWFHGKHSG